MIATTSGDPFFELIERGWVHPADTHNEQLDITTRILRPTSLTALIETVHRANQTTSPFFFLGGGTAIAQTPLALTKRSRSSHALGISFEALNRVVEYRPMDFVITVEAGMQVAHLRELLAARGQSLMLDTPRSRSATIGGLLASGRVGPRRRRLGRTRDAVLGAHLVLADGTLVESGGRSPRRSAGYDLARLFVGSYGSLGAYGLIHLQTHALPEARRCIVATLPEGTRDRVRSCVEELLIEPTAALILEGFARDVTGWDGPDGRLLLFFEGAESSITRATRDLRATLGAIGISETRVFDRESETLLEQLLDAPVQRQGRESSATLRIMATESVDIATLRDRVRRLTGEIGVSCEMITDLQNGELTVRIRTLNPRSLEAASRETFLRLVNEHPHATLLDAPAPFRSRFEEALSVRMPHAPHLTALRQEFDPYGLCAVDRRMILP